MTGARAQELTLRYGRCICCGRALKAGESVEQGIGPKCVESFPDLLAERKAIRAEARAQVRVAKRAAAEAQADEHFLDEEPGSVSEAEYQAVVESYTEDEASAPRASLSDLAAKIEQPVAEKSEVEKAKDLIRGAFDALEFESGDSDSADREFVLGVIDRLVAGLDR